MVSLVSIYPTLFMNLKKDPKWQITSFIQYGPMKKALRSLEEMSDGMLKNIIPVFEQFVKLNFS